MAIVSEPRRPPRPCGACGEGVFIRTDVKGHLFAYREELDLEMPESLLMYVCNVCGEMRESAANSQALDEALGRTYAARHRAAATEAVARLTTAGWRQVEIEQVMALSTGYLSKALRGEKALSGPTLRHLIHVSHHPRKALGDLAPLYPNIKALQENLSRRGVVSAE